MDNFAISLPLFNCLQTYHIVLQPCTPTIQLAFLSDAKCKAEISQHQYILTNYMQFMDIDHNTFSSNYSHHTHLHWRNHKICYNKEANSHLMTTPSLQCYIVQLPSTPIL